MHNGKLWLAFVYNGLTCHSFLTLGCLQNEFMLLGVNLKNCKEAGRTPEMPCLRETCCRSLRTGGKPQTQLEPGRKSPPFVASAGPSAVCLHTRSSPLPQEPLEAGPVGAPPWGELVAAGTAQLGQSWSIRITLGLFC